MASKPLTKITRVLHRHRRVLLPSALIVAAAAGLGLYLLNQSSAASYAVTAEAESGTRSPNTAIVTPSGVSGTGAVRFGGGTTTPPPPPPSPGGSPIPSGARLVYSGDYNTGSFSQWRETQTPCQPSSASIDRSTVRDSSSVASARYSVGSVGGCGQRRAEVYFCGSACVNEGDVRWYSFSIRPDANFPGHNGRWFIIMQWHSSSGSPPLALDYQPNGNLIVGGDGVSSSHRRTIGPLRKGVWTDYVMHVRFSRGSSGYVEIWENNVLKVPRFSRPTMSSNQNYLKQGLYTDTSIGGTHTLWHDSLKVYAP